MLFQVFQNNSYNQYLMMALIVLAVIALKIWSVNRTYSKKMNSFIHPDTVLPQIKKKFTSIDDAQKLLAYNVLKVFEDYDRIKTIAFLVAYLSQSGVPIKPLKGKMNQTFGKLQKQKMTKVYNSYKHYILEKIQSAQN